MQNSNEREHMDHIKQKKEPSHNSYCQIYGAFNFLLQNAGTDSFENFKDFASCNEENPLKFAENSYERFHVNN